RIECLGADGLRKEVDTVTVGSLLTEGVPQLPDLNRLSHAEKSALIHALWTQVQGLTARVAALEAKLNEPSKNPDPTLTPVFRICFLFSSL
ncbi:MAG TPA: hypothetical protein VFQ87_10725, partial [Bradyrhizobium sp.]|nr:hypothetical protein [Bradyrhizobium sp.]